MKVFLGGTCSGWKWRNKFQKMLKCDYYNPMTIERKKMLDMYFVCYLTPTTSF